MIDLNDACAASGANMIADDDADMIADDDLAGLPVIDLNDDADDDDDADGKRRPKDRSDSAAVTVAEWCTVNGYDPATRRYTGDRVHLIEPRPPRVPS